ncbi:hypothetical protein ARTHRO9AX_250001 [Arthrobacter sp. 9AX]|uniref:hypothetical protein n=1 Tax=Bacteria TaxID=2 RepID=UPI0012F34F87|nr:MULTISPECIES: hypothetical protein [Bacteria]VXC31906.1 hypothetical protein ARTHRO9AX_250001 [Arthrobacter sp. 9AX]VXD05735.1 hypothetical protein SPHINGOT1_600002 [Sphingomonas sp. T1]VXD05737.1 hypothetical protein SPHINGOT1_600003 [Sphingomonas sp. T1]
MATLRPRITFTPDPQILGALDRISVFRGVSKSELVNEFLGYMAGPLAELADALAVLHSVEDETAEAINDIASHVVSPQAEAARATTDFIARRRAAEPPSCNTGVTTLENGGNPRFSKAS